ncbi:zinc finger domain-containing protein [Sediminibacillus dalangtanensis]
MKLYTICRSCRGKGSIQKKFLFFRLDNKCPVCNGQGKIMKKI